MHPTAADDARLFTDELQMVAQSQRLAPIGVTVCWTIFAIRNMIFVIWAGQIIIFERTDDGLGGETVADGIAAGSLLAFLSNRTGAVTGIATVGLDLPEGRHGASAEKIGFVLRFRGPITDVGPDAVIVCGAVG